MKKTKIHFIVKWDRIKEKTWSGTCYSLFLALNKYVEVIEIPLPNISILQKVFQKIRIVNDLGINYISKSKNKIEKSFNKNSNHKIFQFTDIIHNSNNIDTYVYQDMSVSYLKYMYYNKPLIFNYSGFGKISERTIEKRYLMEKEYFSKCSGIFTMGQWYKKFLIEKCNIDPAKVHHVGGGINLNVDKIDYTDKKGNKILFVGRDFKRKGGELVYKAFTILKEKYPNYELHVAGPIDNPIRSSIQGYFFYGDCDKDKLSCLFNKCDIFCMPSYYEAYGLVFIEALTYGLPCIGRNVYEMSYFIDNEKTGFLIENDDPYILAEKMFELLNNKQITQNVRRNKDFYINEYSWDTVASRISKILEKNV